MACAVALRRLPNVRHVPSPRTCTAGEGAPLPLPPGLHNDDLAGRSLQNDVTKYFSEKLEFSGSLCAMFGSCESFSNFRHPAPSVLGTVNEQAPEAVAVKTTKNTIFHAKCRRAASM